jgi:hypothetical protein
LQNPREKIACVRTASLTRALDTVVADHSFQGSRCRRVRSLRPLPLALRRLGSEELADWALENRRPQRCLPARQHNGWHILLFAWHATRSSSLLKPEFNAGVHPDCRARSCLSGSAA